MYYCNFVAFFTKQEVFSFSQFITEFHINTTIKLQSSFMAELMDQPFTIENYQIDSIKEMELGNNQRNYNSNFLKATNFDLFTQEIELGLLIPLLLNKLYISLANINIYQHFKQQYNIENGKIYGCEFVLYDKKDIEHKHSLYLVDYSRKQSWTQLYRKIRLAQEVKKSFILVLLDENQSIKEINEIKNMQI